ncbi:MAG: class II aldolase/adducin family protein [Roseiarcus sp.]|jgi:L-fuculose-phosphate aldolase
MATEEKLLRAAIVAQCRALNASGLNQGTAGNISARLGDALVITPSAIPYDLLRPEMLAVMPLNGEYGAWSGPLKPSSEWRFHLDIMRARPDIGAIVHSHPPYATALAMLGKPILAAHYMIALFGGPVIECVKYAPYGTKELSDLAIAGLGNRHGVLLGNHGAIATGASLESAMHRAVELEALARMYYLAIAVGRPTILSDEEIARIVERFKTYGGGIDAQKALAPIKKRGAKKKATRKKAGVAVARK